MSFSVISNKGKPNKYTPSRLPLNKTKQKLYTGLGHL